jgi:hypothetical protein
MATGRIKRPQLGEVLEAEALVAYLDYQGRRGTITPFSDRILVKDGLGEERFELIRVAQGVRWKRTR